MKISRVVPVMLASLAGGIGIRLAFAIPAGPDRTRGARPAAAREQPSSAKASAAASAGQRPAEDALLAARGGPRVRLLIAWLAEAREDELLRLAEVFAKSNADYDDLCLRVLMVRWAELNPRGMMEWARARGGGHYDAFFATRRSHLNDAIEAWARVDFESAWAAAGGNDPATRAAALRGLSLADPDKCLRLIRGDRSLLNPAPGYPSISQVLDRLAEHDPAAVAALLDEASPEQRKMWADDFALTWAKSDPAAAVAWMAALDPAIRNDVLRDSGAWLAEHAPEHLPALLEKLPAGRLRSALQAKALETLASTDPDAARRQVEAMPAGPAQQYGRVLLVQALCDRGDDAAAAALASQIGWTVQEGWCPSYVVSLSGESLTDRSTHTYGDESDPYDKTLARLLGRIAVKDPEQAAAFLAECSGPVALFSGDPAAHPAAMAELLIKGTVPGSDVYLRYLSSDWMEKDPVAAASWATGHGTLLDSFVARWGYDPAAALDWMATLPNDRRQPLLEKTVASWAKGKQDGLPTAIRGSALPEDVKEKLLTLVPAP